ncbi:MAG: gfo/Idh/MocA family oxidoreductase [Planctomycetes bacterium]|nr:gfo/Idh/MocA family oxidoreductase [Planctomycetota bacterium]
MLRRQFLCRAAMAVGPMVIGAGALGADRLSPGDRTTVGAIGIGGRGRAVLRSFLSEPRAQVVAVCDVDAARREAARREADAASAGCAAYNDFRELLARPDIDAVVIATPDHWHVPVALAAARAGKDIYCEKPLSLTIAEGRTLVETVRRCGRVFQTGSQLRSQARFRTGCELARNRRMGTLRAIRVGLPTGPFLPHRPPEPPPDGLDYDFWLGQAPWSPYVPGRCHGTFRYIFDYSGGTVTDFGAHDIDLAQWGHGTEHTGPVEIEGRGDFPSDGLSDTATNFHFFCTFADGVVMEVSNAFRHSVRFEGDDGWIYVGRDRSDADPRSLLESRIGPNEIHLYESRDHTADFLDGVRSRGPTIAPPETAHRSVSIAHLANIAMRLGRKLRWDPQAERFVGDAEADRMLSRAMRPPWHL